MLALIMICMPHWNNARRRSGEGRIERLASEDRFEGGKQRHQ